MVDGSHSVERAWPIRYGATIVGALWCHWSMGVPLVAQDVTSVLGLAATAAAPAVHDVVERHRTPQLAGALVPDLIGESHVMETVRHAVLRAAASPFPVLIEGESGSGKELVARAIHATSARRSRRFCALNCAAIADELVEAELFGHTRGAFTGAVAERLGLFEEAQGGTLFLDEVAELSARVQAKLLRTLQEARSGGWAESSRAKSTRGLSPPPIGPWRRKPRRGASMPTSAIASTCCVSPFRRFASGSRTFHRWCVMPWSMLANRTGSRAVLSPSALSMLGAYDWPGNVRELQNVLASVMVAGPQRGVIGPQSLPAHITRATAMVSRATLAEARRDFEARYVRAALARAGGRVMVAARDLGVSRQGLNKLTARLGLSSLEKPVAATH